MLFTNWNVNAKRNKVPNAPICWNSEQLGNKISLDRQGKFLRKRKFYIFWTWHALTQVSLILGLTQNLIWSRAAEFYLEFPEKWEEISVAIEKKNSRIPDFHLLQGRPSWHMPVVLRLLYIFVLRPRYFNFKTFLELIFGESDFFLQIKIKGFS